LNKFPDGFFFSGFLLFFIIFHLLGNIASVFSDGVLIAVLFLLLRGKK